MSAPLTSRAVELIEGADKRGISVRLAGGLAVRYLCGQEERPGHDIDLASVSVHRTALSEYLSELGFAPDRRFNALHGHKQLYFCAPDGLALDVFVDRLEMCHTLDLRKRLDRLPVTLDVSDLLLSKLQVVQLNQKDYQDILLLLGHFPVEPGDRPGTIGIDRFRDIAGSSWPWWRTITDNLRKVEDMMEAFDRSGGAARTRRDAAMQLRDLMTALNEVPKSLRWRLRSLIGERWRWYNEPEEAQHG
jgi:hypothetical protein